MDKSGGRMRRREMLVGCGTIGVTAGVAALEVDPGRDARGVERWDHEADIVVAGTGIGGSTAAIAAHENGDQVVMLEKSTLYGGTSAKTAAVLWIPNNFVLRERGVEDRKEDCLEYMARFSYPQYFNPRDRHYGVGERAYALMEAFYDNAAKAIDFLREKQVLDVAEWRMFKLDHPATDYLDSVPENRVPQGRALGVRREDGTIGVGVDMMAQMKRAIEARDIPVLLGHRAVRLLRDDTGRVIGVESEHDGALVRCRARKAVIFATGGYAHNAGLIAQHQRARPYGACALTTSEGDFTALATAVGARIGNMSAGWRTQVLLEESLKSYAIGIGVFLPPGDSSFQVNKYGRRVVDEACNYDDRADIHSAYDPARCEFPNQVLFWIYDQRTAEAYAGAYPLPDEPAGASYVLVGDSFEALGERIRERLEGLAAHTGGLKLDASFVENLQQTKEAFNRYARSGHDEDFNRGSSRYDSEWKLAWMPQRPDTRWPPNDGPNVTLHPLSDEGPYYAILLAGGLLDTCGGPEVDAAARVVDAAGQPIPGLLAAGNCIASPSVEAYWGGGCPLALSLTYAYIAANAAHHG